MENLILAVPPKLTEEIVERSVGSGIKRVWMVRGIGKGAYLLQNIGEKSTSTVKSSNLPTSIRKERNHLPATWISE